jgi:hypothetical protein
LAANQEGRVMRWRQALVCPGRCAARASSAFTRAFDALWRGGALQTRDPGYLRFSNRGPASAVRRFTLHRVRDTR